jgi:hypothetical protein
MDKLIGFNKPLQEQIPILTSILSLDEHFMTVLRRLRDLDIPQDYYVMSGWPAQIVANYNADRPLNTNVKECDIVYWEADLSSEREQKVIKLIETALSGINLPLDITNEARAHLWLPDYCGIAIKPYPSIEAAITSMTETITCLGIRLDQNDDFIVFAPFGLNDIFGDTIRPVKDSPLISEKYYTERALGKQKRFPNLKILPY